MAHGGDGPLEWQAATANTHRFTLRMSGVYRVKGYQRDRNGNGTTCMSERHHVLDRRQQVRCYVDPTGERVGTTFFDVPVVAAAPADTDLIGHANYAREFPNSRPFTLDNGSVDLLSSELHKYGAMDLYRLSRTAYLEGFLEGAYYIQNFIFNKYNCRIPFRARIGEGTRMGIGGIGAVIHPDSIIGTDCVIAQNVTLGSRAGGNGTPVIGNNVFIAPGAKLFGGKVGSNVVIGANSVVLDEIPDNCVVAGVPARIVSREIEKYRGYTHRPPQR